MGLGGSMGWGVEGIGCRRIGTVLCAIRRAGTGCTISRLGKYFYSFTLRLALRAELCLAVFTRMRLTVQAWRDHSSLNTPDMEERPLTCQMAEGLERMSRRDARLVRTRNTIVDQSLTFA